MKQPDQTLIDKFSEEVTEKLKASAATARVVGKTITFVRGGKLFRGRLQKDADCFNFKWIK